MNHAPMIPKTIILPLKLFLSPFISFLIYFHIFSVKKKFWIKSQILLFFLFFVSDLIFFIFLNFFFDILGIFYFSLFFKKVAKTHSRFFFHFRLRLVKNY
jgi:hypothetical protein